MQVGFRAIDHREGDVENGASEHEPGEEAEIRRAFELRLATGEPGDVIAGGAGLWLLCAESYSTAFQPCGGGAEAIHPRAAFRGGRLADLDGHSYVPLRADGAIWTSGGKAAGALVDDLEGDGIAPDVFA